MLFFFFAKWNNALLPANVSRVLTPGRSQARLYKASQRQHGKHISHWDWNRCGDALQYSSEAIFLHIWLICYPVLRPKPTLQLLAETRVQTMLAQNPIFLHCFLLSFSVLPKHVLPSGLDVTRVMYVVCWPNFTLSVGHLAVVELSKATALLHVCV